MISLFLVLLKKDLLLECRKRELFSGLLMTALLIAILFVFILNSITLPFETKQAIGTAAVFISGILGGLLAVERSLRGDFQQRALDRLQVMQVSFLAFYLAKCVYNFFAILTAIVIAYVCLMAGLSVAWSGAAAMLQLAVPVALAIAALLSLLAGLTYNSRLGSLLLVIIGLPLLMPLLAFAIDLSVEIALTGTFAFGSVSYNFILGLLAFYLLLGINLADHVYRS